MTLTRRDRLIALLLVSVGATASAASATWTTVPSCFKAMPGDRAWSAEWTLVTRQDGKETDFDLMVTDGSTDDTPALQVQAKQFMNCLVDAIGPTTGARLRFSTEVRSQREGGIDPNQTTVKDLSRPGKVAASAAPLQQPARPEIKACLAHFPVGTAWTSVAKAVRGQDGLSWTMAVTGSKKPVSSEEAAITRFARCFASNLGLSGRTVGPTKDGAATARFSNTAK